MKTKYIPSRDGDLNAFEENFRAKIGLYSSRLELPATDIERLLNILETHKTAFLLMNSKRAESRSATEGNILRKRDALNEIRRIIKKIKGSVNYDTEIGNDLGIVGSELPLKNYSESKPLLKAKVDGSNVIITFRKYGTDGIRLYSKRASETEFKFLAIDTSSPYVDSREKIETGKPEQREYYAFYFYEDIEVGIQSDILKAIVP